MVAVFTVAELSRHAVLPVVSRAQLSLYSYNTTTFIAVKYNKSTPFSKKIFECASFASDMRTTALAALPNGISRLVARVLLIRDGDVATCAEICAN